MAKYSQDGRSHVRFLYTACSIPPWREGRGVTNGWGDSSEAPALMTSSEATRRVTQRGAKHRGPNLQLGDALCRGLCTSTKGTSGVYCTQPGVGIWSGQGLAALACPRIEALAASRASHSLQHLMRGLGWQRILIRKWTPFSQHLLYVVIDT